MSLALLGGEEFRFSNLSQGLVNNSSSNSYTPRIDLSNPQGITGAQRGVLHSRISAQNETATTNAIGSMLGRYGGNSGSAGMIAGAARLKAGAGSSTAASMADIDIGEVRNNQDLTMKNKALGLQAEGIGATRESTNLNYNLGTSRLTEEGRQFDKNLGFNRERLSEEGRQFDAGLGLKSKELDSNIGLRSRELDDAMARYNRSQTTSEDQYKTDRQDRLSTADQNFQLSLAELMASKTEYGEDGPFPGYFTDMINNLTNGRYANNSEVQKSRYGMSY